MKRFMTTAATLPFLAVAVATAQSPDTSTDEPVQREQTVIVTALGKNRTADELIGNATSLDRDDIIEALATSLGDTLDAQPGVASTFFGQGASRPVLRGLGAERVLVLTNGIGVIDASAASPDHQVAADGIDAEKIEILRGPAALSYGGQAIGGVVNVIDGLITSERPDEPFSADVFGAYNSVNDGSELGGRLVATTGPLVFTLSASGRNMDDNDIPGFAESSRLRAAEEAEEHDDEDHDEEQHGRGTVENSFVETSSLAGGLSWVSDDAFFGIAIRQQTSNYGLPGHAHIDDHDEDEEEHDEEHDLEEEAPFIDLEQTRVDVRGGSAVNWGVLTGVNGSLAIADYNHTEFESPGEPGTVYETDGTEARIELSHSIADFNGAIGLQFLDKSLGAFGDEAFIRPTNTESIGVFLYDARDWDSGFGIEGGLRVDRTELTNVDAGGAEFDLFSASFGLHQHWQSGWFIGAQISHTERAPNESELFADGVHLATTQYEVGNSQLGEESGLNMEGVVRWSIDTLSFGVNLFASDFSNFIYLTPGMTLSDGVVTDIVEGLPVFQFVQDDAEFIGGELYAEALVTDGLAGADWTLAGNLDVVQADLSNGGNVPFIPPLTLNASATADWTHFTLGASVTLAADQDDAGAGQFATDGYTSLNLRGAVRLSEYGIGQDGTELFVEARNITDEEIRHATSVLKDLTPAPGRNVRMGVRLSF